MDQKFMRVIALRTLREFWEIEPNAETGLRLWYAKITARHWANPNEIIAAFPKADVVGNNRIIFNIRQNDYRLIIKFEYEIQQGYVRFIGTHEEYDKIDDVSTI
jgi:mRNA interferase HigB